MFPAEPGDLLLADPDPRESRRTKIARRFTIGAAFLLLAVALVGVLYTVSKVRETSDAIRATQLDNRSTLETAKQAAQSASETADRIKDCTEPTGRCFEESQKRTGAVVQKIINELTTTRHISILASACATDPALRDLTNAERIDAIDRCVRTALRTEGRGGRRAPS